VESISSEEGVKCKYASCNICGIVAEDPDRCLKGDVIDLQFDNGLLLKEVPFLVYESSYNIVFGNNDGKSMFLKDENLYIYTRIWTYSLLKLYHHQSKGDVS
jgi:hypothetical protein